MLQQYNTNIGHCIIIIQYESACTNRYSMSYGYAAGPRFGEDSVVSLFEEALLVDRDCTFVG
jgi:hypothetical protein